MQKLSTLLTTSEVFEASAEVLAASDRACTRAEARVREADVAHARLRDEYHEALARGVDAEEARCALRWAEDEAASARSRRHELDIARSNVEHALRVLASCVTEVSCDLDGGAS